MSECSCEWPIQMVDKHYRQSYSNLHRVLHMSELYASSPCNLHYCSPTSVVSILNDGGNGSNTFAGFLSVICCKLGVNDKPRRRKSHVLLYHFDHSAVTFHKLNSYFWLSKKRPEFINVSFKLTFITCLLRSRLTYRDSVESKPTELRRMPSLVRGTSTSVADQFLGLL